MRAQHGLVPRANGPPLRQKRQRGGRVDQRQGGRNPEDSSDEMGGAVRRYCELAPVRRPLIQPGSSDHNQRHRRAIKVRQQGYGQWTA
eukprot:392632-Pyramimonas_sp.AAC.1